MAELIVCHIQYQLWDFLCVIQTLEVNGPVNQMLVTGPVTIQWEYIPLLLGSTESLCAFWKPKRGTLDGILIVIRVFIPLAFG